jgi:hypothetical protein
MGSGPSGPQQSKSTSFNPLEFHSFRGFCFQASLELTIVPKIYGEPGGPFC